MGVIPVGLSLLLLQDKLDALHATSPWLPKRASLSRDVGTPRAVYRTTAGLSMFHRQNSRSSWKTGRYRTLRGGSIEGEGPEDTSSSRSNADISAPRGGGGSLRTMEGITADAEGWEESEYPQDLHLKSSFPLPPLKEETSFFGPSEDEDYAPTTTITRFNTTDSGLDTTASVAVEMVGGDTSGKNSVASTNTTIPLVAATFAKRKDSEQLSTAKSFAKKLKNRNHLHLRRKVFHASTGLGFAILNNVVPRKMFVASMALLSFGTLLMELVRYRKGFGWVNDALFGILGAQLRKHEMEGKFTGSFYFLTGVTLTAATLPPGAASLGIMQLAIADPSASYFGQRTRDIYWSRIQNGLGGIGRNKGILGFLGGALMCVPFNYRALSLAKWGLSSSIAVAPSASRLALASLAMGLAGSFADLAVPTPAIMLPAKVGNIHLPPFHIDDNFVVPIFSGWACAKLFSTLGWPADLQLSKFILV